MYLKLGKKLTIQSRGSSLRSSSSTWSETGCKHLQAYCQWYRRRPYVNHSPLVPGLRIGILALQDTKRELARAALSGEGAKNFSKLNMNELLGELDLYLLRVFS